jgi:transcriptional regulator GlxA family with amidase domain
VDWLRAAAASVRRTTSVCSGAFVLAQAGLLDGKRAATHWALSDRLKELHPTVELDRDAIFVHQGSTWTSAGVTAGIDLSLALVEADCGRDVALAVARELVVFVKRPGGHAQFSAVLEAQLRDGARFEDLHLWIADNLGSAELTVDALAGRVLMSPRNFSRVYKETTGRTPAKAVEMFRLEAARRLLEDSSRNIDQIARDCGFGDEGRMRQCFQRNLSLSPSAYRERLAGA